MDLKLFNLLVFFTFVSISPLISAEKVKLGLAQWVPFGVVYMAKEKGFWKEQGLYVEIIQYKGEESNDAILYNKIDFTMDILASAIEMSMKNKNIITIAEYDISMGGDRLIISHDVKDWDQLKGKTIASYSSTLSTRFFLNKVLTAKSHLKFNDIKLRTIRDLKSLNKALERKAVDGIFSYDPQAYEALDANLGKEWVNSSHFPGVISDVIVTHKDRIKNKPDTVKKFMTGFWKAQLFCYGLKDKKKYYDLINKKMFKGEELTHEDLKACEDAVSINPSLEKIISHHNNKAPASVQEMLSFLAKSKIKLPSHNVSFYFDPTLSIQAAKSLK